jgi:hypothetical protein
LKRKDIKDYNSKVEKKKKKSQIICTRKRKKKGRREKNPKLNDHISTK